MRSTGGTFCSEGAIARFRRATSARRTPLPRRLRARRRARGDPSASRDHGSAIASTSTRQDSIDATRQSARRGARGVRSTGGTFCSEGATARSRRASSTRHGPLPRRLRARRRERGDPSASRDHGSAIASTSTRQDSIDAMTVCASRGSRCAKHRGTFCSAGATAGSRRAPPPPSGLLYQGACAPDAGSTGIGSRRAITASRWRRHPRDWTRSTR